MSKFSTDSKFPTKFSCGEQVRCTDSKGALPRLTAGKLYFVKAAKAMKNGYESIWVDCDDIGGSHLSFEARRFEKVS